MSVHGWRTPIPPTRAERARKLLTTWWPAAAWFTRTVVGSFGLAIGVIGLLTHAALWLCVLLCMEGAIVLCDQWPQ